MIPFIIWLIILSFIVLFLFIPVGIGAKYEEGAFVIFKISFWTFEMTVKRTKKSKGAKKPKREKKDDNSFFERAAFMIDFVLDLLGDTRRFVRRHFSVKQVEINVALGTTDALATSVATGGVWALIYNVLSLLDRLIYVDSPKVNVSPIYNSTVFRVDAKGIIETRPAYVIATGIIAAYKYFKHKKAKTRRKKV